MTYNMNFLLEEEEKLATLDELIAFIECSGQCSDIEDCFLGEDTGGASPVAVDGSGSGDCYPWAQTSPANRRNPPSGGGNARAGARPRVCSDASERSCSSCGSTCSTSRRIWSS